jgi:hypothetical protein
MSINDLVYELKRLPTFFCDIQILISFAKVNKFEDSLTCGISKDKSLFYIMLKYYTWTV